ncbi:MAG: alkaline phosphatase family protein [bacterium]
MKKKLWIFTIILLGVVIVFLYNPVYFGLVKEKKQMIFIGVDGVNVNEYNKILSQGELPNFKKLVENGGLNSKALITGHSVTETAPGNAELHTGLPASTTLVFDNTCGGVLPKGKTIFERLSVFDSNIKIGSIYGKGTCYLNVSLFKDAKKDILWWQDRATYKQRKYVGDNCADSEDVANKSLEFLNAHKDDSFYLFVYFGAPDCAGHTYGSPSNEYTDALKNVDNGLGIILDDLKGDKNRPQIIISGDHGWNPNTKGHSQTNLDTRKIILISNNSKLIDSRVEKKQCDIAPTILDYFGMNKSQYADITANGCSSLR